MCRVLSHLAERGEPEFACAGEDGVFQLVRRLRAGLGVLPGRAGAGLAEHHHLQAVGAQERSMM
jgi:hypothetical protein